ncbi:uncharacterized protein LOC114468044 [Gouania willdenowi]|uniref:uncharacterized protein LOC114468044 n=1 Tax=Gouania willdenowi TaxID=441366 RepID=UPI001054EF9E|nr:uncharacterized protein LOC114468044 [Gouania willdenowi]XP_028310488.1 uncharacterized protein LOC114468044 [Gouania willdenowi]
MKLGLLLFLGIVFLVPHDSESRTVSEHELKKWLKLMLHLPPRYGTRIETWYKNWILSKVIFEAKRGSHLNTGMLKVCGIRNTALTNQTTKAHDDNYDNQSNYGIYENYDNQANSNNHVTTDNPSTANKRRRKRQFDLDDGSGSGMMPLENMIHEEEIKFDEQELIQDDNYINGEEYGGGNNGRQMSTTWSVGYYGIFQLSDSHFCDSGYRWSRNKCKTSCTAFLDDDIEDDIFCLFQSGFWQYLLGHHVTLGC